MGTVIDYEAPLEACARGDRDALRDLFETEAPRLVGVAQWILRRRDLAEEAVQDGFTQIWRNAARFDRNYGSARGWIYAVIRHRALNILRDGKRYETATAERLASLRESAATQAWEGLDVRSELHACLAQLAPDSRRATSAAGSTRFRTF